jgi:hypothetical protein
MARKCISALRTRSSSNRPGAEPGPSFLDRRRSGYEGNQYENAHLPLRTSWSDLWRDDLLQWAVDLIATRSRVSAFILWHASGFLHAGVAGALQVAA